jgi:Ca2+-binding EF-hand superfamily protein
MPKRLLAALLLAGTVAGAGQATASEPYLPRAQKMFNHVDLNQDGKISADEFLPLAEKRFMRVDQNNDNAVSSAEIDAALKAAMERRRGRIMANMDTDKNGSISRAELDAYAQAMMKGADSNGDGGVSMDEVRVFKLAKWRKAMTSGPAN